MIRHTLVVGSTLASLVIGLSIGLVRSTARPSPPILRTSRRTMTRWATVGALAVLGAQASVAALQFLRVNRTDAFGQPIVAATLADLPALDIQRLDFRPAQATPVPPV